MTCAICKYYDVCILRNTRDACTHDPGNKLDPLGINSVLT